MKKLLLVLLMPIYCYCQIEYDKIDKFTKTRTVTTKLANISKNNKIVACYFSYHKVEILPGDILYPQKDLYESSYVCHIGFAPTVTDYIEEATPVEMLDKSGIVKKYYTNGRIKLAISKKPIFISFNIKPIDFLDYLFTDIRIHTTEYKMDFEVDERKLFMELNYLMKYISEHKTGK